MAGSGYELFSDEKRPNFPLQTSYSSSSESEPEDRDMTDLLKVGSSTPKTSQKQGTMVCLLSCCK